MENNNLDIKKERKFKAINIFIILNILFLLGCCIFYGSRLVHYYKIENPDIKENETIYKLVTLEKNIVTIGDGLYKTSNGYTYKGKNINNYVKYSGRIWRIVSVSDEGIKLITDTPQTSLVWGIGTSYSDSLVRSWLNNEENSIKSFYESLSDVSILNSTNTCIDVVSEDNVNCTDFVEDKVGLLSAYEYQEAGGDKSYLNIGEYWWTSNVDENNDAWYVYSKGSLNNTVSSGKTYYTYGVRPTITIKGDTRIISGDGTKENPYSFDIVINNLLNTKYVGDYINYNNYTWRIIETDDNYVKVVMEGVIKVDGEDYYTDYGNSNYMTVNDGIGRYLNTTFYNSLENKDYILNYEYNMGRYDKTYNYDFNKITEYKEKMNVGLLQLGELFVTDVDNYFLSTRTITTDGTVYEVLEDGKIYAGSVTDKKYIRPTLYLRADITVNSGTGSINEPYMIG